MDRYYYIICFCERKKLMPFLRSPNEGVCACVTKIYNEHKNKKTRYMCVYSERCNLDPPHRPF